MVTLLDDQTDLAIAKAGVFLPEEPKPRHSGEKLERQLKGGEVA